MRFFLTIIICVFLNFINYFKIFYYELFELRYNRVLTVFVGQYSVKDWHPRLGGGAHTDSILDRIIHNSITIESGKTNMREIIDSNKYKS